ncbi:DEAD/DEAH box helicase [Prevotella salivae]|uniref:RNA helicase n=1 Tax=Segatella salivae TaxID=228604 RepID=A0AAW4NNL6_9BACT|nr:DEAD/DEAH box helicase [Segatella salivae]MBW4864855.1 DEAD/DEAH box helicase [Segatella salivae]MBW4908735.1 DEAD/DEAH box helicase [Segatella salivae]
MKTFEELGVNENIRHAIEELGFEHPMPVQEEVIPYLLGNKNDVIALAQTGTGKTAAFGLPLLQKVNAQDRATQAIVLSPTRELCVQIADDLKDFSKYIDGMHIVPVYGGADIRPQIRAIKHGTQVIVATPGRLVDLINRGVMELEKVNNIVLDEADEMLNMGFSDSINAIFEQLPEDRNTLLFSATMSREVEKVAKSYLHDYKEMVVGSRNEGAEHVNHIYYLVHSKDKYLALKRIVDFHPRIFAIIFCRTKAETQEVADKLIKDGYNAEALHGDLSQQQRDLTMQKFRQHTVQLLVATDVAARGLDVDDLTHVINYGLPDDIESYTHRSGRTGRAGKKGTSISIIHIKEKWKVRQIEKQIGKDFIDGELPKSEEICKKQLFKVMDDIMKTDVDEDQIAPYMADIMRQFEYVDKEDIIKKMVTVTFGRFLDYYQHAPEIEKPVAGKGSRSERGERNTRGKVSNGRRQHVAEEGFRRLFINLGKSDGFYPGEIMQYLNKHVHGRQEVGHIDLLQKFSYIEVPEDDAQKVMKALNGTTYKGREVRCNDADETGHGRSNGRMSRGERGGKTTRTSRRDNGERQGRGHRNTHEDETDWRSLIGGKPFKFKGEEPDFNEEGWARRRPKKK